MLFFIFASFFWLIFCVSFYIQLISGLEVGQSVHISVKDLTQNKCPTWVFKCRTRVPIPKQKSRSNIVHNLTIILDKTILYKQINCIDCYKKTVTFNSNHYNLCRNLVRTAYRKDNYCSSGWEYCLTMPFWKIMNWLQGQGKGHSSSKS